MSINSRSKGGRGEREAARVWNELFNSNLRRAQQFCGASDESDDIIGQEGISIEVKRRERFNLAEAVKKVKADAAEGNVPIVLHRANHKPWLISLELKDLPELIKVLNQHRKKVQENGV